MFFLKWVLRGVSGRSRNDSLEGDPGNKLVEKVFLKYDPIIRDRILDFFENFKIHC